MNKLNEQEFKSFSRSPKPKYVKHLVKTTIPADSISFLYRNGDSQPQYQICDRYSHIQKGGDPGVRVSLIKEDNNGIYRDYQIRLAFTGNFHVETPAYFVIDPRNWVEVGWVMLGKEQIRNLIDFLFECIEFIDLEKGN